MLSWPPHERIKYQAVSVLLTAVHMKALSRTKFATMVEAVETKLASHNQEEDHKTVGKVDPVAQVCYCAKYHLRELLCCDRLGGASWEYRESETRSRSLSAWTSRKNLVPNERIGHEP